MIARSFVKTTTVAFHHCGVYSVLTSGGLGKYQTRLEIADNNKKHTLLLKSVACTKSFITLNIKAFAL